MLLESSFGDFLVCKGKDLLHPIILRYKYNPSYGIEFEDIIKNTTNSYVNFVEVYTKVLGQVDTTMTRNLSEYSTEPEYVYCIYVKGVMMFDSLYNLVGKTNFIKSLKIYYEKNQFKNAKPDNLINSFEFVSKTDLDGFFSSWINGKVVIR